MPPPSAITAPLVTVAVAGQGATAFTFEGVNLHVGDRVKWVSADAPSCSSEYDRSPWTTTVAAHLVGAQPVGVQPVGSSTEGSIAGQQVSARFAFPLSSTGLLSLCYKFMFQQQDVLGRIAPTPYILFPGIRVVVLRYDNVVPSGTAVGCASKLVVHGAGFESLRVAMRVPNTPINAEVACNFGASGVRAGPSSSSLWRSLATVLDDSRLECFTPEPTAPGALPLRVDLDVSHWDAAAGWSMTASHAAAFPGFTVFAAADLAVSNIVSHVDKLVPVGAAYNLQPAVTLSGYFTRSFGDPRCRFGSWSGGLVTNATYNATHVVCRKPRFPDSARGHVGPVLVAFSPNGQCFGSTNTSAPFVIFNSQVNAEA